MHGTKAVSKKPGNILKIYNHFYLKNRIQYIHGTKAVSKKPGDILNIHNHFYLKNRIQYIHGTRAVSKKPGDILKIYNHLYLKNLIYYFHGTKPMYCFVSSVASYELIKYPKGTRHRYFMLSPDVLSSNVYDSIIIYDKYNF